jgi:hypothetical protein
MRGQGREHKMTVGILRAPSIDYQRVCQLRRDQTHPHGCRCIVHFTVHPAWQLDALVATTASAALGKGSPTHNRHNIARRGAMAGLATRRRGNARLARGQDCRAPRLYRIGYDCVEAWQDKAHAHCRIRCCDRDILLYRHGRRHQIAAWGIRTDLIREVAPSMSAGIRTDHAGPTGSAAVAIDHDVYP